MTTQVPSMDDSLKLVWRTIAALKHIPLQTSSSFPSSIYIYDLIEQRTLVSSSSVGTLLGYSIEVNRDMDCLRLASLVHPDDLDRVATHYQRFTTLRYGEVISLEYRMLRADGTWSTLRSQETPLDQEENGSPLQIVGIVQDITQLILNPPKQYHLIRRSPQKLVSKRIHSSLFASNPNSKFFTQEPPRKYFKVIKCQSKF